MKLVILVSLMMIVSISLHAQLVLKVSVKNSEDKTPLIGATVSIPGLKKTSLTDSSGTAAFNGLPGGSYSIKISYAGFEEKDIRVTIPSGEIVEVELSQGEAEEELIIKASRISRSIANLPTRVEVISGEELAEKGNMKPGDIRMMLNESTGIQTQQTSATSFNAGIRIQGLEGRYTQILKDGYPLYAGFSGGLSILQIAPLDLQQVEVIKGAASTLYGGGAIAGLVNLVSKTPGSKREFSFLANGTSAGGLDLSGYYRERYGKTGLTLYAARNSNKAFDPANIGLTAIPRFERYTINPRLFLYGTKTTADLGVTLITETRTGGSMEYIKNGGSEFFEKNNTDRLSTQIGIAHRLNDNAHLQFKNSYSHFNRVINVPDYTFDALQQSTFSELTWNRNGKSADWVVGANLLTDDLAEHGITTDPKRDYHYNTYGLFIQNAWTIADNLILETGLRGDQVKEYGFQVLPRASLMIRLNSEITTRIGGGYGYKTPTIFTEEAEKRQFQGVLPININGSQNERSVGANWDINYRTHIGDLGLSLNHLFFYTKLDHPLVMTDAGNGKVELKNSTGYIDTKGMETNLRLTYGGLKLFVGYTYTDAQTHYAGPGEWLPLTAKNRLNNVLMYEIEDKLKLGLEAYYFSKQQLTDGSFGKSYWIAGFMAEKLWEKFSVFINFENFTDTRQSKFDIIYTGTLEDPVFKDIYAPVEGFVVNGGFKIRF